jgi:mRNA interferase MazF
MRPVIIVQNDIGNRNSPTVIVVPITSQIKKEEMPTHISLRKGYGLEEDSIALCEHVDTIDKQRLLDYIGHISAFELRLIARALAISVGLVEKYNKPWIDGPKPRLKVEETDSESPDELLLACARPAQVSFTILLTISSAE